uniref:Uncharacterized protein n=1 Tax=Pithovirus LCDPAC01 TaxID=2506600 RepID=A0A481YMK4_9VIRU|nr:MAG: hypothetical protein LCDPAC01_00590 [Pithovirus LCDPAC01]
MCSWIFFWNFPGIGGIIQSKPIYTEDLVIRGENIMMEYRFKIYYVRITNILLAIVVVILTDYTFFKNNDKTMIEIAGVLGGVLALYQKVQTMITLFLLKLFFYLKEKKLAKLMHDMDINILDL